MLPLLIRPDLEMSNFLFLGTLKVDFVLLGGDLFHDNNPSRYTLHRTMELLKTYCFGPRPGGHAFEILSDQSVHFQRASYANVSDENVQIKLPIFSIHGNHDDPGEAALAALDILHITSMINYFGKTDVADEITVHPLILRKGASTLALYGLGNIRDERLSRIWNSGRLHFSPVPDLSRASEIPEPIITRRKTPTKRTVSSLSMTSQNSNISSQRSLNTSQVGHSCEDCLKVLVLHQNRVAHSASSYVSEEKVKDFDFVVWGHEHESAVIHATRIDREAYITQPGSTVATSLSEGETAAKHCVLLQCFKNQYQITPLPMTSVRPFRLEQVNLAELNLPSPQQVTESQLCDAIAKKLSHLVNRILDEIGADTSIDGSNPNARWNNAKLPLVRLKVNYTGYSVINSKRFGQDFVGRVANPGELLLFSSKRLHKVSNKPHTSGSSTSNNVGSVTTLNEADEMLELAPQHAKIEDFLSEQLSNKLGGSALNVFHSNRLIKALQLYAEKDGSSLASALQAQLADVTLHIISSCSTKSSSSNGENGDGSDSTSNAMPGIEMMVKPQIDRFTVAKQAADYYKRQEESDSAKFKKPLPAITPNAALSVTVQSDSSSTNTTPVTTRTTRSNSTGRRSSSHVSPSVAPADTEAHNVKQEVAENHGMDDYDDYEPVEAAIGARFGDETEQNFSPNASWTSFFSKDESENGEVDSDLELPDPDSNRKRPPSQKTSTPRSASATKAKTAGHKKTLSPTQEPVAAPSSAGSARQTRSGFSVKREEVTSPSFPRYPNGKASPKASPKATSKPVEDVIIIDSDDEVEKSTMPAPKRPRRTSALDISFGSSDSNHHEDESLPMGMFQANSMNPLGMNTQPSQGEAGPHSTEVTPTGKAKRTPSSARKAAEAKKNNLVTLEDDDDEHTSQNITSTPSTFTQRWGRK